MRYARSLTVVSLATLLACLFATSTYAQDDDDDALSFNFNTDGPTLCGENENVEPVRPNDPPDIINPLRYMRRDSALDCDDAVDDAFGSSGFSATYERARSAFFPFINIAAGIIFETPGDSLSFLVWRLPDGPTEGRVSYNAIYNTISDTTLHELDTFPLTETPTRHSISLHPITETFGIVMGKVNFFFQGRYADAAAVDSSGAFYLDEIDVGGGVLLPVELTSFTARTDGHAAVLRWHTASETRNSGFVVEWRNGGEEEWKRLGFVEGAGTTSEPHDYAYRTEALTPGAHTFRLRQIDTGGHDEVHGPVTVEVGLKERFALRAPYPNPARAQATVAFASRNGERVEVALFDALGRRVQTLYDGTPAAGQLKRVQVSAGALASGLYVVRLRGAGGVVRTRALTLVR